MLYQKEENMSLPNEPILTNPLSGFMELLPAEQMVFNKIFDTIRQSYEMFGFIPVDTPILERAEVLLTKVAGETEKQIYQFQKGDTNLAMRFDLTVPLTLLINMASSIFHSDVMQWEKFIEAKGLKPDVSVNFTNAI